MPIDVNEFLKAHGVSKNPVSTGVLEEDVAPVIKEKGWCPDCGEEVWEDHRCGGVVEDESDPVAEAAQLKKIELARKDREFLDSVVSERGAKEREQSRLRMERYREKNRVKYNARMKAYMKTYKK